MTSSSSSSMSVVAAVACVLLLILPSCIVHAECPNACSAHGKCGAYDMCICYRNWMANDCSERICQFGLAHVDSPKGDLDASSGALTGPSVTVIPNDAVYPYGTTEQYPATVDSNGNLLTNTAHTYMECSNKGICDRATGLCTCFAGYEGSACQRASCPLSSNGYCSGHGSCQTIKDVARLTYSNMYDLWDEFSSMGCVCDPGYQGADCSQRVCKVGADPLYHDDYNTVRYSNFTYQIYTTRTATANVSLTGNYSIVFYDAWGKPWQSGVIDVAATCLQVIDALEQLPNSVIPTNSVRCQQGRFHNTRYGQPVPNNDTTEPIYDLHMSVKVKFILLFSGNPGKLKQPSLNLYLDGSRPSLYCPEDVPGTPSSVGYAVFPNGFAGENTDLVPTLCTGLQIQLTTTSGVQMIAPLTDVQSGLLKTCLGDSNGNPNDNQDVYNWDTGATTSGTSANNYFLNPHLIKLIDATQDLPESAVTTLDPDDYSIPGLNDLVPSFYEDETLRPYPKTRLCNSRYYATNSSLGPICSNKDPAGFFAVLYYDSTLGGFAFLSRPAVDYGSGTYFHVYTTTGHLQLVSPNAVAVTHNGATAASTASTVRSYYSNTVYLAPNQNVNGGTYPTPTSSPLTYDGALDCASDPQSTAGGALDCLDVGDLVMLLNTDLIELASGGNSVTAAMQAANPVYPDIYTVGRVSPLPYSATPPIPTGPATISYHTVDEEITRHPLVLDLGVNNKYFTSSGTVYTGTGGAAIYKFYPPSGYNYVGQCSNRGLCDTTLGVCKCFSGYTGDNCAVQNALAK